MVFTYQNPNNNSERLKLLDQALDYLNELKEPEKIANDKNAYEAFFFIGHSVAFYTNSLDMSVFSTKNIEILYGEMLQYLFDIRDRIDMNQNSKIATAQPN